MAKKSVEIPAHGVVVCRVEAGKTLKNSRGKNIRGGKFIDPKQDKGEYIVCRKGSMPVNVSIPAHTQKINVCKKVGGFGTTDGRCPRRNKKGKLVSLKRG